MSVQKLLIADAGEELPRALSQELKDSFEQQICHCGQQCLECLRNFRPDIMVLDLMLPNTDGITLLHIARQEGICPRVLAITSLDNHYVIESLQKLGVDYVMVRPCSIPALAARVQDLSGYTREAGILPAGPEEQANRMLLMLGFPTNLQGYPYLRLAVMYCAQHPGCAVTKELYPVIGVSFGIENTRVERSIRNAIEVAWKRGDRSIWERMFPQWKKRPSNAVFITRLASELRL